MSLFLLLQGYYLQCFGYSNDKGIIWYDCVSQVEWLAEHEYEPIRFGSAVTVKGNVVVCGDYRSAIYNKQKDLYVFFLIASLLYTGMNCLISLVR